MSSGDTSVGGSIRSFPATTMGLIGRLHSPSTNDPTGLEELCRRYWKPVYCYVRVAWSKSNEEAKDLTQAFFLWLIEGDALERYLPERGGFRPYLKTLLRRFVGHREVASHRIKRGGRMRFLPLDDESAALERALSEPSSTDPEKVFDDAWVSELMRLAVRRLRERMCGTDREVQFKAFETHDLLESDEPPTYADIARTLGVKESQVRDYILAMRREIRAEIRAELTTLTRSDPEMEEEWSVLFG